MGRRLGRKRLYALEKLGQSLSGSVGAGVSGSLVSRTVHREGQNVVTDIVIDLGSSKGAINVPDKKRLILGVSASSDGTDTSGAAHFGYVGHAQNGIVTLVEATCLETPTGAPTKIELQRATSATKAYSGSAGTRVMELPVAAIGSSSQAELDADDLEGNYLYLAAADDTEAGGAVGTYTGGKLLIRLYGTMIPDDI